MLRPVSETAPPAYDMDFHSELSLSTKAPSVGKGGKELPRTTLAKASGSDHNPNKTWSPLIG
jgi:hypothetical protein